MHHHLVNPLSHSCNPGIGKVMDWVLQLNSLYETIHIHLRCTC